MCLIIHKPKGQEIPQWVIESAQEYNPDGVGIMAEGDSRKFLSIKPEVVRDTVNGFDDCAVHFRMATHGRVDKANVHPFKMRGGAYLMHNGILHAYAPKKGCKAKKSDSALFVQHFCNPMILKNGSIPKKALEAEIGSNAIAIMNKDGSIHRYGKGWNEYKGCFMSNEYAWDAPYSYSGFGRGSRYYTTAHRQVRQLGNESISGYTYANDYGSTYGDDMEESLEDMVRSHLEIYLDDLPLDDYSEIGYNDLMLMDQLADDTITRYTFIDLASNETLVNLYRYTIKHF